MTVFEVAVPVSAPYLAFTDPVTDPVIRLLKLLLDGELTAGEMRDRLSLKHRPTFRENYIQPAVNMGLIVRTIPDKPNSRLQRYKLSDRGRSYLKNIAKT